MYSSDSQQGEISYPAADIWQCMETFFCSHNLEEGVLLASSDTHEGMLMCFYVHRYLWRVCVSVPISLCLSEQCVCL